jgi:hypothetical protein
MYKWLKDEGQCANNKLLVANVQSTKRWGLMCK